MKLLKPVFYFFAACCLVPSAQSQEYYDPTGESVTTNGARSIRIYVEYFEVSTLELADIMSLPGRGNDDTKMRADLLIKAKAKTGNVSILESQTLISRSGERATTESITEFIYPTEYDLVNPAEDEKKGAVTVIPTAFETRNLGATLEVEPILAEDGSTIDVTFKPEITYHIGDSVWGKKEGSDIVYKMPTIYTLRVNTSFTLTSGKFHFVSALTPKDDNGKADTTKKILVFIKADILKVGL